MVSTNVVEAKIDRLLKQLFDVRVDRVSLRIYQGAIVLVAILLPLDRVGFLSALHLSILTLVLLAQRWVYVKAMQVYRRTPMVGSRLSYALLLPAIAAVVVQSLSSLEHPYNHAAFTIILLAIRAFIVAQLLTSKDLELFEKVTYLVCLVVVAFGLYQYVADVLHAPVWVTGLSPQYTSGWTFFFPRPQSTAQEPLYLAYYLALPLALLTLKVLRGIALPRWQRLTLAAAYGLLLITLARGAIIGMAVALAVVVMGLRPERKALLALGRVVLQGVLITLALTLFSGIITGSNALGAFRSHAVDLNDESAKIRYRGINPALESFLEQPLFGHGIVNNGDTGTSLKVNNTYLTILVEQGLLGVLAFIPIGLALALALQRSFRNKFASRYAPYVAAALAMGIQANTFEAFQLLRSWIVIACLIAAYELERSKSEPHRAAKHHA